MPPRAETFLGVSGQLKSIVKHRILDDAYKIQRVSNKYSAVAKMCDCFATIDMGRKVRAEQLFRGSWVPHLTQCHLHRGLPPHHVTCTEDYLHTKWQPD